MNIINIGHQMKYENECMAMLFFPGERVVTVSHLDEIANGDSILTRLEETDGTTLVTVEICLDGQKKQVSCPVLGTIRKKQDELERVMGVLIYQLLSEATGRNPSWGILTGIRPVKLFHKRLDAGISTEKVAEEFARDYLVSNEKIQLALETASREGPILKKITDDSYSLYISIPFCPSRCAYCSFVSHSIDNKKARDLLPRYVDLLCKELEVTAEIAKKAGLRLKTVYYGGGTPTTLSAQQLEQVCKTVERCFDLSECVEYTVEAGRPDTIDLEKLQVLKRYGVTRISINPQTLNDAVLKEIGRQHTVQQTLDAFRLAREVGFDDINMDLIAGLPTETVESFCATIDQVIGLNPENVTVHTLSIKRSSHFGGSFEERTHALEASLQVEEMVKYARQQLTQNGLYPYYLYKQRNTLGNLENTGYCKPGKEGRYNIFIMDETQTILAAGGGAVTKLRSNRTNTLERVFNYKYPFEYIDRFDEVLRRKNKVVEFFENNYAVPVRTD